jgi:Zn finger protein HypA/HybF involved in hydrogenase expression
MLSDTVQAISVAPVLMEPLETLCAWCGRFKNPDGTWGTPTAHRLQKEATHGICPQCLATEMHVETEGI